MPYTVSWMKKGVIWTFHGVLTNEDVIQANLDIYGDPRFDSLRWQIVDISGVERFDVSVEAMDETAALDEAATLTNSHLVVAVVAMKQEAVDVARMYANAMEASPWKIEVFSTMQAAEEWVRSPF